MSKVIPQNGGSTLFETILGIALLSLFLVILAGSVTYLEQSTLRANEHEEALSLAREGLEAVRSMRDRNFSLLEDGAHGLTRESGNWEFIGDSDGTAPYTRTITISHDDASTTKVTAQVQFGTTGNMTDTVLETDLTDWQMPR